MSRRRVNCIIAVIVIALAAITGISIFNKSNGPVIRSTDAEGRSSEILPGNHPPENIARRLTDLIEKSDKDPQNAQILTEIGNIYFDLGEYDKAIARYRKSLEIQPRNPHAETDMATCLHYLDRHDEALLILNNVLNYRPDFPSALYNKGVVLIYGKKDTQGGLAAWEELLKQDLDPAQRAEIEQRIRQFKPSVR